MLVNSLLATFVSGMLGFAILLVSLFLILLILVQRGRGGGLTGALGGPGGQSAFGTKAGDLFTRITSFVALGWISLCAFTMWLLGPDTASQAVSVPPAVSASPADGKSSPVEGLIDLGKRNEDAEKTDTKTDVELTPANPATTTPPADEQAPASESPASEKPADAAEAAPTAAPETPAADTSATPPATSEAPAAEAPAAEAPAAEAPATEAPAENAEAAK